MEKAGEKIKGLFRRNAPAPLQLPKPEVSNHGKYHEAGLTPTPSASKEQSQQTLWPRVSTSGDMSFPRSGSQSVKRARVDTPITQTPSDKAFKDRILMPPPKVQKVSHDRNSERSSIASFQLQANNASSRVSQRSVSIYSQWHPEDGQDRRPVSQATPSAFARINRELASSQRHSIARKPVPSRRSTPTSLASLNTQHAPDEAGKTSFDSYENYSPGHGPRGWNHYDQTFSLPTAETTPAGTPRRASFHETEDISGSFAQLKTSYVAPEVGEEEDTHYLKSPVIGRLCTDWTNTPPASPHSYNMPSPSGSYYEELKVEAEDSVRDHTDDTWDSLWESNAIFRLQMDDTTGIRDWWYANMQRWIAQKKEIARAEKAVTKLRWNLGNAETRYSLQKRRLARQGEPELNCVDPEVMTLTLEVDSEEFNLKSNKAWFINNRRLMKEVWKQYQAVEKEEEEEAAKSTRRQSTAMSIAPSLVSRTSETLQIPEAVPDMPFEFVNVQSHYNQDVSMLCNLWVGSFGKACLKRL